MNVIEAKALVEKKLERLHQETDQPKCAILNEETIETAFGWVFFYQSTRYIETGHFADQLAGNAPFIVNRFSSAIIETGTANEIEYYIKEYERGLQSDT